MKDLILVFAKALVDHPDDVEVIREEFDNRIIYKLIVHPDDTGKIIGRNGKIIRNLRTVITSASAKESKPVKLEIVG
jgi:predicted RNA-binding protein YlqC (UPF0109 family)